MNQICFLFDFFCFFLFLTFELSHFRMCKVSKSWHRLCTNDWFHTSVSFERNAWHCAGFCSNAKCVPSDWRINFERRIAPNLQHRCDSIQFLVWIDIPCAWTTTISTMVHHSCDRCTGCYPDQYHNGCHTASDWHWFARQPWQCTACILSTFECVRSELA